MKVPNRSGEDSGQGDGRKTFGQPSVPPAAGRSKSVDDPAAQPASTARATADAAVVGWNTVAETLVPIIGQSSVTVLYRRCLVSVGATRTWLPAVTAADLPQNDWTVLHASVSRQTANEASEACTALFATFRDLLGSLIGPSLTEQLLQPVSALPSTGSAEQDTLP
jgi:hypothetical protein